MRHKFQIVFFLTLLLSVLLRVIYLVQYPEGFDQTETSFSYNAYSVLKTGRDEDGKFLPLIIATVGDYKLTGYMYWQVPFIAIFGLNEFSSRLSTAVAGVLTLLIIYLLVYEKTKNRRLSLITFFVTSISPWHIALSRMAYDPMIALLGVTLSLLLFTFWEKSRKIFYLIGSLLSLSWAIGTYYAVWVIIPFLLLFYFVRIFKKSESFIYFLRNSLVLSLPLIMIIALLFVSKGDRLKQDSTFQTDGLPLLQEQIREDQHAFPLVVTRIFHNKFVFYPQLIAKEFFENLSFDFLFLTGDDIDRRFSTPYHGVLYIWSAPFLFFGILMFWKKYPWYQNLLLLGSTTIIFLGSSFSIFGSESQRTLFAAPIFCFYISYALFSIVKNKKNFNQFLYLLVILSLNVSLFLNVAYFGHQYLWHSNVHQPWARDFGMHQMIKFIKSEEHNYKKVVVPESTYMFFYFYNKVDPKIAWSESSNRLDETNYLGMRSRAQIGNYLTMPGECPSQGKLDVLYVCRGNHIPKGSKVVEQILYRDEQPAFTFIEFNDKENDQPLPPHLKYMDSSKIIPENENRYW